MANKTQQLTLEALYKDINSTLKGSFLANEDVDIVIKVKLPDEERNVELLYAGSTLVGPKRDIGTGEMLNRAQFILDFETKPE